jgi:hypothetical protein
LPSTDPLPIGAPGSCPACFAALPPDGVVLSPEFALRYRLLAPLGAGASGTVYRALQVSLEREIAVKFGAPHPDPEVATRFVQEGLVVSRLSHPRIAQVYDAGQTGGTPFLAMELVRGSTLARRLAAGPLPLRAALDLALEVLDALALAHSRGIVHRDVKPENILLDDEGHAKVTDFGIAKVMDAPGLTLPGLVLGSPAYISPEVVRGQPPRPESDLYAVGVILFEMLAGRLPFEGSSPIELLLAHRDRPPPVLTDHRPDLGVTLAKVVERALAKNPVERFRDATSFARALVLARGRAEAAAEAGAVRSDSDEPEGLAEASGADPGETAAAVMRTSRAPAIPAEAIAGTAQQRVPPAAPVPARPHRRRRSSAGPALASLALAVVTGLAIALWPRGVPLQITNRRITVGPRYATVELRTSRSCFAQLEWTPRRGTPSGSPRSDRSTNHRLRVQGLPPDRDGELRVRLFDEAQSSRPTYVSEPIPVKTQKGLHISDVTRLAGPTWIHVTWKTSVSSIGSVAYGDTPECIGGTAGSTHVRRKTHEARIDGLAAGRRYYLRIDAADYDGKQRDGDLFEFPVVTTGAR